MRVMGVGLAAGVLVLAAVGCREDPPSAGAPLAPGAAPPTNRVNLPSAVRQNLGVTFAKVEARAVARTLRVPGRFELLPGARREYRAPAAGRVEVVVAEFDAVERGTVLYRLDAPEWRDLQLQTAEAQGVVERARLDGEATGPLLGAHRAHRASLEETVRLWQERVDKLREVRAAGGGRAEEWTSAQASLSDAQSRLAEVLEQTAELEARGARARADFEVASVRRDLLLQRAATLLGVPVADLTSREQPEHPLWLRANGIAVRAAAAEAEVVERVHAATGAWKDEDSEVVTTVRLGLVRFRGRGLQSDLGRLRDGLPARVVAAWGNGGAAGSGEGEAMEGRLTVGLVAHPDERTVDLLVTPARPAPWARAGVSAFMEVTVEGNGGVELAIPLACVARDGLTAVIFRRDPADPDRVIRQEADLGLDDGRWVVVRSGVGEGDEVVLEGVYQLMLATSGTAAKGGHFHSDGTFHEGPDEK